MEHIDQIGAVTARSASSSGPAKLRQDAIADVAGDKSVVARDHLAAKGSIRVQQAAQFFGIELFAQRRRTNQVAEHHRQLPGSASLVGGETGVDVALAAGRAKPRFGSAPRAAIAASSLRR